MSNGRYGRFLGLLVFVVVAVFGQASDSMRIESLRLVDTRGHAISVPPAGMTVFCFLGTECPLAKLYGSRLQSLSDRFSDDGITFIGVNSNLQDSPGEIDSYASEHGVRFPIAKDADQSVADALGATRTPEVIVVDWTGKVRYRGRIDDQYQPGVARAAPQTHDLRDAIESLVAGKEVAVPVTQGVGCLITRAAKRRKIAQSDATYTFNRDIAPILNRHCVECHRAGEIGPFELSDYDEVVGWADMILEVIDQGRMPPWHADPSVGKFQGARELPRNDRDVIASWIEDGMPQGDPNDLPDPPRFASGWHLETLPDLEIAMRDRPFSVPAEGVVEYQYFVVDPGWETDRWVYAAQVVPGNASVVHHTIVFVRPPDGADFSGIGWLGAYVPGQRTIPLPAGHARRIPAGSKLVFQMHYTPNGKPTLDRTRLGIWFAEQESVTDQVTTHVALNHEFEIPPGEDDFRVELYSRSFPRHGKLLGITPHMHFRGKSFQLDARRTRLDSEDAVALSGETASREAWLRVPAYDFNWQHWYAFAEPHDLAGIDSLDMTAAFDNSRKNPFNPDPGEYVSWGDQTWEEMAVAFYDVATPRGTPTHRIVRNREVTDQQRAQRLARAERSVEDFLADMDRDGDGIVAREETPEAFRRFGFRNLDHNRDGRITRDEVFEAVSERD